MAKEQVVKEDSVKEQTAGHTTIGLSKPMIGIIFLVIAIMGFGAFWKDRGGAEATAMAGETFLVNSHEKRITKTEVDITNIVKDVGQFKVATDKRFDTTEHMQIALKKDQEAILINQTDMKRQIEQQTVLQIQQIKAQADIGAWIKAIDNVK